MTDIDNTPISPMKLAKQLNIAPQRIYQLLRQGRVKEVSEAGTNKKLVRPLDVIECLDSPQKAGRPSTQEELEGYSVKPGTLLTWVVEVHKQVAVLLKEGETNATMKGMLRDRTKKAKEIPIKRTRLAKYIKDGTFNAETELPQILEAVVLSARLSGREEAAVQLEAWLEFNKGLFGEAKEEEKELEAV